MSHKAKKMQERILAAVAWDLSGVVSVKSEE